MDMTDERRAILTEPVSVLMPIYNESDIIEDVVREWHEEVIVFLPEGSDLLFDDASDDETTQILHSLKKRYPYIRINHSPRDGFGNATRRLYTASKNPLVFFTDSDGQYLASDFWKIAREMGPTDTGAYDMINGYKTNRQHPSYQILGSDLFNGFVRLLFSSRGRDINSAFKLIRRPLLDDQVSKLKNVPTFINSELYIRAEWAGYRIRDVAVGHRARGNGISKVSTPRAYIKHGIQTIFGMFKLRHDIAGKRK